ncbi:MAG: rhomboid family protein [Planctomycetes bacterium]|nr:rhomboid family protein [Planctomycetota bacterium]
MAQGISRQRCFNHASREAAARCPACRRYFCRECVTEHGGRLLCAGCLRGSGEVRRSGGSLAGALSMAGRLVLCAISLAAGGWIFYLLGRLLICLPNQFHEGTFW